MIEREHMRETGGIKWIPRLLLEGSFHNPALSPGDIHTLQTSLPILASLST